MGQTATISVLDTPRTKSKFPQPAPPARVKPRHVIAFLSFALIVILPLVVAASYLWFRAQNQFASTMSFTVRSEEPARAVEMLGGLAGLGTSQSSDSDILYDYLHSQRLIKEVNSAVDLVGIWSRPQNDPLYRYRPDGTVEDLHRHWEKMVQISRDSTRGIIELNVRAFTAKDAQHINQAILNSSTVLVNNINNIAHADAIRYARVDLSNAQKSLSTARQKLTQFRIANQIVDPALNAMSQSTLLGSLQSQLAETLIELDIIRSSARKSTARIREAERKAEVISARIESEKNQGPTKQAGKFAEIYGEFERLSIDVNFAEEGYQIARARYDAAASDARRNTRYLAAHIRPTLAEKSEYPRRGMILTILAAASFLIWAILILIGFSMLDRR